VIYKAEGRQRDFIHLPHVGRGKHIRDGSIPRHAQFKVYISKHVQLKVIVQDR
jgi:hypothetical protein